MANKPSGLKYRQNQNKHTQKHRIFLNCKPKCYLGYVRGLERLSRSLTSNE